MLVERSMSPSAPRCAAVRSAPLAPAKTGCRALPEESLCSVKEPYRVTPLVKRSITTEVNSPAALPAFSGMRWLPAVADGPRRKLWPRFGGRAAPAFARRAPDCGFALSQCVAILIQALQ